MGDERESGGAGAFESATEGPTRDGEVSPIRSFYTPAMLARLIGVPVATIRRWRRRGLIVPVRELGRVAYYDFGQVTAARDLGKRIPSGKGSSRIERQLARLSESTGLTPARLPILIEGKRVLLRESDGLRDAAGQRWIDFDGVNGECGAGESGEGRAEARMADSDRGPFVSPTWPFAPRGEPTFPGECLVEGALELEADGDLEGAADAYRAALAAGGPNAELCFQLAETLYRLGDVAAARERYFMAIELDEHYVEARANLGCVLAESGRADLAIAALEGALSLHADYADAHYHLARMFDDCGDFPAARRHWERFLECAPDNPWADEARARILDAPEPGNRDRV